MAFEEAVPGLGFKIDWIDADGVAGPELAATWASLRIEIGDSVVTRVFDERSRTVRDIVFVPLYPLAEWLASNWWFLLHEFENPSKEKDPNFYRRHALGSAREGYGYPELQIISSGHLISIVWTPYHHPWSRYTFLERGGTWVDSDSFQETCADLIESVIERLREYDLCDTFLEKEWTAIREADNEETEFCKTAAGLGLDPYAIDDAQLASVLKLGETLSGIALEEATAAIDPENLQSSISAIKAAVKRASQNTLVLKRIMPLSRKILENMSFFEPRVETRRQSNQFGLSIWIGTGTNNPWNEGYELARKLRHSLELGSSPLPTIVEIAKAIGESPEQLKDITRPTNFGRTLLVEGVVTRDLNDNPAFAFPPAREDSTRFLFCRALANVLAMPKSDSVLTKARSWRQQRGHAFAAEFLAPSSALRERISTRVILEEDVDQLAKEFGVSSFVIQHQINNHKIAQVWSHPPKLAVNL